MNPTRRNSKSLLALLVVSMTVTGVMAFRQQPRPEGVPPVPADVTGSAVELLSARPFKVDEPFIHYWRSERPLVERGQLLVLAVDPQLVFPRQSLEPVLYVGAETAERINQGDASGRVIAVVPGEVDLSQAPIFFGEPALPEEVDRAEAARQLERARAAGVVAPSVERIQQVSQQPIRVADHHALRRFAADLIERHSPEEAELVRALRMPVLGER